MSLLINSKDAFFEMSVGTRYLYLFMPSVILLLLFVVSNSLASSPYKLVWGFFLICSILAERFSRACESAFNENHKAKLDEIIMGEVLRYGGSENVERDFWKSNASRESLRDIVPDEMIDSPLVPSSRFWGKVGKLGMFLFIVLPIIAVGIIAFLSSAAE
ncbi:MAG: hypothetical protein ABJN69_09460 [Hellea sp.]